MLTRDDAEVVLVCDLLYLEADCAEAHVRGADADGVVEGLAAGGYRGDDVR
jgi:hypothetical protein